MVLVTVDLPPSIDKAIRHMMIDKDIVDKRLAIVEVLERHFKQSTKS
jgi:hypothetical protein